MTNKKKDPTYTNVYMLGSAMSLCLLGIKVAINLIVPILGNMGSICMALLWLSSAIASFFIPLFLNVFKNERSVLFWMSIEYGLYVLSFAYVIPAVAYVWSFIHGVVATVLWAAEGVYLSSNMNEHDKGRKSGIFWAIYMSGTIIGNLAIYFILRFMDTNASTDPAGWHGAASYMFLFLGGISLLGCIIMYLLKPAPQSNKSLSSSTPTVSISVLLHKSMKMMISHEMIWLLLPMAYLGFEYAYVGCMLTRQVDAISSVGLQMAVYSFIETIISSSLGKLLDQYGTLFLMTLGTITQCIGTGLMWYANIYQNFLFYLGFTFLALSDSAYNTLIPAIVGEKFIDQESANTVFRLFQNSGSCICYLISSLFVEEGNNKSIGKVYAIELLMNILLAVLSQISFYLYKKQEHKHVLPKVDIENAMKPIPSTNDKEDENEIDKDKNMIKSNEDFVN